MNTLRLLSAWSLRMGCRSLSIFSSPLAVLSTGGLGPAMGLREASVDEFGSFFLFFLNLPFPKSMDGYLVPEVAISLPRITSSVQSQSRKLLFFGKSRSGFHLLDSDNSRSVTSSLRWWSTYRFSGVRTPHLMLTSKAPDPKWHIKHQIPNGIPYMSKYYMY